MLAGSASEAARRAQKSYTPMKNGRTPKKHKKIKNLEQKRKNLEITSFFGRAAAEGPPKEGSGRGPESDLPEDSMIF